MQRKLEYHRNRLFQQILPQYERLGSLTCVYLLGSLVSGYTTDSDLDIMMVWDGTAVPAGQRREELVARLDERKRTPPFVVDYHDIHLERYTIAEQEYNVAHLPLTMFQTMIQLVLDGTWNRSDQQLNLLTAAAGFSF